jgi:serine/threonine-protein kinase
LLSDFGIARMSGDGRSSAPPSDGGVAGAAAFMSPEQARGEPVDSRSDLYSLGVVGYYALTGRLPFTGETDALVLALHATTPPPPLADPGVPRRLAQAVERCLAKQAGDRFADGAALGRALGQALPQHAVPPIAVRAFLTRSAHLAGPALMYGAFVGLIAAPATLWCWLYTDAGPLCGAAAAALACLLLLPFVVAWARARRLLADGHGWEDLVDALVVERERHCEELHFVYGESGSAFERALLWLARFATLATAAVTAALFVRPELAASTECAVAWASAAGTALVAASVAQARTEQRTDPRGARRLRFWSGWVGRALFRLAASRGRRAVASEGTLRSLETPA